jgi:hypothetical protein
MFQPAKSLFIASLLLGIVPTPADAAERERRAQSHQPRDVREDALSRDSHKESGEDGERLARP